MQIPDSVKLVAQGSDWLRFQIDHPEKTNPELLQFLLDQNLPIISLQEVPRSLEEVYIEAVAQIGLENEYAVFPA